MKVTINPKKLNGTISAIASKSYAHRIIIAAALADKPTKIYFKTTSEDIEATIDCIKNMGAEIFKEDGYIIVNPIKRGHIKSKVYVDCNESGSTARFLLPVLCAICENFEMTGRGRLPERPFTPLISELVKKGVDITNNSLPLSASGTLLPGEFTIAGNISSQYITGLMFALSLLNGDSKISLTTELESRAYIDITLEVLKLFKVEIKEVDNGYIVPAQKYISPGEIYVEGDWSNAAFWVVADKIGNKIEIENLNYNSKQGDMEIINLLDDAIIDAKEIPDIVPILAVLACSKNTKTQIKNAQRLRLKESDRLKAITQTLSNLGADIKETDDGLIINGHSRLFGGVCDSFSDHRIAMCAAIASIICDNPVTITNAEAVNKSYPDFFRDFAALGGDIIIE